MRPFLLLALLLLPACGEDLAMPKGTGRAPAVVEDAQVLRAELEMKTLAAELAQYHAARGEWPADWRALRRGGKDPWGNDYGFEPDGDGVLVFSAGPDGEFDTDDDITGR
jgi:hypothetical protein